MAFAGSTAADADTVALVRELSARGASPLLIGTDATADAGIPPSEPELEALLAIIRGQQVALECSTALGFDPDRPAGLSKVTLTD